MLIPTKLVFVTLTVSEPPDTIITFPFGIPAEPPPPESVNAFAVATTVDVFTVVIFAVVTVASVITAFADAILAIFALAIAAVAPEAFTFNVITLAVTILPVVIFAKVVTDKLPVNEFCVTNKFPTLEILDATFNIPIIFALVWNVVFGLIITTAFASALV